MSRLPYPIKIDVSKHHKDAVVDLLLSIGIDIYKSDLFYVSNLKYIFINRYGTAFGVSEYLEFLNYPAVEMKLSQLANFVKGCDKENGIHKEEQDMDFKELVAKIISCDFNDRVTVKLIKSLL